MASLANPRLDWADESYDDAPSPAPAQPVATTAAESGEGTSTPPSVAGISLLVAAPSAEPGGAAASAEDGAPPGGILQEEKQYGKRVTDVDAETDRMARMFLGKENEQQAKQRLKIVQANPNSHLCSAKTFDEMQLPPHLLKGVQHMGFEKPSVIQETALPICLRNPPENLLAQAQSGSGKTAAFCLAGLYRVDTRLAMPQLLIVTPTRELAVQCFQETLLPMSKFMDPPLTVFMSLKGTRAPSSGIRDHVVVGTPGSLIAALKYRKLNLNYVNVFVLDEADAMLEASLGAQTSHRQNCIDIKENLPAKQHQTLLFSATFSSDVKNFGLALAEAPVNEITLPDEKDLVLEVITQLWIDLRRTRESRLELLQELYDILEMGQSIIFCRTRADADRITNRLNEQGFRCSNLHGDLLGEDRDACMEEFRQGLNKVLITTNVLARGVDVPAVSLVVNYDMPSLGSSIDPDPDTYLHRIGRTGRFGRRGVAINLIHDEVSYRVLQAIDRHFSPGSSMVRQATTDVEDLEKIIVEESKKRVAVLDPLTGLN